jgi:hypothetical protein
LKVRCLRSSKTIEDCSSSSSASTCEDECARERECFLLLLSRSQTLVGLLCTSERRGLSLWSVHGRLGCDLGV